MSGQELNTRGALALALCIMRNVTSGRALMLVNNPNLDLSEYEGRGDRALRRAPVKQQAQEVRTVSKTKKPAKTPMREIARALGKSRTWVHAVKSAMEKQGRSWVEIPSTEEILEWATANKFSSTKYAGGHS